MRTQHWFLIIAVVAIGWVFLRGGEQRYAGRQLDYDRIAVSQGLSAEAAELNLADDLDPALLPEIGKQVIRDGAQQGLREQAFLEYVLREVSTRVREISTIDLNADDTVDPILVRPEPQEGEQFVLLSLRVPSPEAYPLPEAGDEAAWKEVETIEVATMTVTLNEEALTVQAQGNEHVYPGQAGNYYVARDTTSSFLSMYLGMRMMEWMFFPSMFGFWGPGYGYGYYNPAPVGDVARNRGDRIASRNYGRANSRTQPAVRNRAGRAPTSQYSRAYSSRPPQSLNRLRSSRRFQARQGGVRSGGFGRGRSAGSFSSRRAPSASRSVRRAPLRSRGFRRSFGRSFGRGFGGFGRGGFRFRRCHGCWRGPAPSAYEVPLGEAVVVLVPAAAH